MQMIICKYPIYLISWMSPRATLSLVPCLIFLFSSYFHSSTERTCIKPTQLIAGITARWASINVSTMAPLAPSFGVVETTLILRKNSKEYFSGLFRPLSLFLWLQPDYGTYSVNLAKSMLSGFKSSRQYVPSLSWSAIRQARDVGQARDLTVFLRLLLVSSQLCSLFYYA